MKRFAVLMLLAIGVPTAASALEFSVGRDGIEVIASAPAELDAFMRADLARWKQVIEAARIRAD